RSGGKRHATGAGSAGRSRATAPRGRHAQDAPASLGTGGLSFHRSQLKAASFQLALEVESGCGLGQVTNLVAVDVRIIEPEAALVGAEVQDTARREEAQAGVDQGRMITLYVEHTLHLLAVAEGGRVTDDDIHAG